MSCSRSNTRMSVLKNCSGVLAALLTAVLMSSCNPDPAFEILESYSFSFDISPGGKYDAGDVLDVGLIFNLTTNTAAPVDSVRVHFEILSGGGTLSKTADYVRPNGLYDDFQLSSVSSSSVGRATTVWTLGNGAFDQVLRASMYDLKGNFLVSNTLHEYGFRENEWNEYPGYPEAGAAAIVADTVDDFTIMLSGNKLYRQGEKYYDWYEITDPLFNYPNQLRTLGISPDRVLYVSTWNGLLLKGTEHGTSWELCTKPYPDRPYYINIYISNDSRLWASAEGYPVRYSDDQGQTWSDAPAVLASSGLRDVFRLTDNTLLYHGSNCCSLMASDDDGLSWTPVPTPGFSSILYVDDNDHICIITQISGLSIYGTDNYKSGFTFYHNVNPGIGINPKEKHFLKWKGVYYILIPGYGILQSSDLVHFSNYVTNSNAHLMFIDHNGVMIIKDMYQSRVFYKKITD